jgi:uncharacterized phage infection (PIP) family protein YhgE
MAKPMASNSQFQGISSTAPQKNRPTVPMSVYRELAGELQSTKNQLDQLKQENQQLHQQNQRLRLEIRQLVQSVKKLESMISDGDERSPTNVAGSELPQGEPAESSPHRDYNLSHSSQETWLSHQEHTPSRQAESSQNSDEVNGWFILAAIVMIILTFSGIGFMVARPLINNSGK